MADITIAGVMRAGAYSPNHIGNDTAIFNLVAEQLRKRGCQVNVYSEEQFNKQDIEEPVILAMCRERASILLGNGIPYPESLIVNTNENIKSQLKKAGFKSCWIKRGDFHAMHKEDVSYVRHPEEAQEVLQEYFYRGITRAVINVHLQGDLVKFYGVKDSQFFYWFYPFDEGHSKYGWEEVNGHSQGIDIDLKELKSICSKAAEELNVVIYGGDCIVDPDGTIRIIDFNDWPSFAPCRNESAPHIAKAVLALAKAHLGL